MGDDFVECFGFVKGFVDLVLDSDCRLCCLVCRTYLPPDKKSAETHVKGKKHTKASSKLAITEKTRRAEKVLAARNKSSREESIREKFLNHRSSEILVDLNGFQDEDLQFVYHERVENTEDRLFQTVDYVSHILRAGELRTDVTLHALCERASGFVALFHPFKDDERCFYGTMPNETVALNHIHKLRNTELDGVPRNRELDAGNSINEITSKLELPDLGKKQNHSPPWLVAHDVQVTMRNAKCDVEMKVLHLEIMEFMRFITPSDEEEQARKYVIETIRIIADALWVHCTLSLFGSYAVGLTLPNSDIDISIEAKLDCDEVLACKKFARVVRRLPGFARRVRVVEARVPIVKIECRGGDTGFVVKCDVSFNRDSSVEFVEQIESYLCKYPALRPLLIVIKSMISQSGLGIVEMGGLPSYGVLLLVYFHLKLFRVNFPDRAINLGTILVSFFELYGTFHNCNIVGVAPGAGMYYNKHERFDTEPENISHFSIQDPNDEGNEIGLNGHGADKIRAVFMLAENRLRNWIEDGATSPLSTILDPAHFNSTRDEAR